MTTTTDFDKYAESYDAALSAALSSSGEGKSYFARGRLAWLAECVRQMGEAPRSAMDYGCGMGSTTPLMLELLGVESVAGVDVSLRSLEVAKRNHTSARNRFLPMSEYVPNAALDLVYCNGVFHHVPPEARGEALQYIYNSLRPGGLFSFWENNPWNPGTRYVMAHLAFDANAVTLAPPKARRFLRDGGFEILRTDFLFIFPRFLRWLRGMERLVIKLPLGAQYQILCRKPRTVGADGDLQTPE
jgi:SAM-dependent methyltransferase